MSKNKISVGILAGGFGSRLGDITRSIPKPLVKINNLPILIHIIKVHYVFYNNTSNIYIPTITGSFTNLSI